MRYLIYGAGGIGSGIGAQLHLHGHEVVLLARGAHLERLRSRGLVLRTPETTHELRLPVAAQPSELEPSGDDVVLLTMKSHDTVAALEDLRAAFGPRVPVIAAQNGVANERAAARRFEHVYGMLVLLPATFLEPGEVLLNGTPMRGVLDAGRYPGGTDHLIERVCSDLSDSGFSAIPEEEIMPLKYGKLILNLGNAVQAVCGPEADAKELLRQLRHEATACLDRAGIRYLPPREVWKRSDRGMRMEEIDGQPRHGGSTWQSLVRGRRQVEVDFLNGEIVLLGSTFGVPTPYNRLLQELATTAARDGLSPGSTTVEEILERGATRNAAQPSDRPG